MAVSQSRTLWTVIIAAAPLAWVLYTKAVYNASTTVSFTLDNTDTQNDLNSDVLPAEVQQDRDAWIVVRERIVSKPFQTTSTRQTKGEEKSRLSGLLDTYLRTTMRLFTYTPQAWLMRRLMTDPEARRTFETGYLSSCDFAVGDRVCGVYVVTSRSAPRQEEDEEGRETVVLVLAPPQGWTGPVVKGRLIAVLEEEEQKEEDMEGGNGVRTIRAVNETVLWRRREGEAPVFLEGAVGRWLHAFMVQWMVIRGVQTVKREIEMW
ncbi:hypothetical protein PFICI_13666 [Pestalotiopsis fici W106-1]|uniref:Uncharacterized protein n=1 Tax=Pestalotiopsis fici (strain W106-1 / CGMCC3.15140) TaxID=1229662 RepID=W3WPV6_PESFW|nr:uncharacterized protein PFICI_13666 [Pestalotiopsis fici W106-1]ETS75182.1 hypothetical protein PFICI_13666 [Pestalotiopsis fici W106-1]